ncbi:MULTISPECIES: hypothetical protein [Mycolicibacterium]|uniref:Uncharacterized protein n=1 Tax=Mycolicibacterium canariasense TaxID=228230 RepID=A0A100WCB2_MYCCR|nr:MULTISPECIES: hypothetical protein [Mycolicibacterium]MCC9184544.1 hypothetical protein [Mycolicibacterium mageritense]MCV7212756.1 hypothetical protein [Mycolicibacterium canariasense]ORV09746.1 hypothetical protein AWB94_08550 [Mycolicibacterium canariasense]GAS95682.1 putative uncharacterized protein [Mycolicibacterium canariasense]
MTDDPPHIIEAVPVDEAGLTWIRCSDESTAEISTGPVSTVGELLDRLQHVPRATPLLTDGYEGGYTGAGVRVTEVQELAGLPTHVGSFLLSADAAAEVAGRGISGWSQMQDPQRPAPVGDPVTAVVLYRQGR